MDNPAIKKAQVSIEFILGFVAVLLLFIGGFNIWLGLNNTFVTETTDYQADRLESGQGNVTIPQVGPGNATMPSVNDTNLDMILDIQVCDCINDTIKDEAIDLYTQQYALQTQVDAYSDVVDSLEQAIVDMKAAYNEIPWCSQCCICTTQCICGYRCEGGGLCDEFCSNCVPVYCDCNNTCLGPAGVDEEYADLVDYCNSCPGWYWGSPYWGWTSCRLMQDWWSCWCNDIKINPACEHTQYRSDVKQSIRTTERELEKDQDILDGYEAEKEDVDEQIEALQPALACCNLTS